MKLFNNNNYNYNNNNIVSFTKLKLPLCIQNLRLIDPFLFSSFYNNYNYKNCCIKNVNFPFYYVTIMNISNITNHLNGGIQLSSGYIDFILNIFLNGKLKFFNFIRNNIFFYSFKERNMGSDFNLVVTLQYKNKITYYYLPYKEFYIIYLPQNQLLRLSFPYNFLNLNYYYLSFNYFKFCKYKYDYDYHKYKYINILQVFYIEKFINKIVHKYDQNLVLLYKNKWFIYRNYYLKFSSWNNFTFNKNTLYLSFIHLNFFPFNFSLNISNLIPMKTKTNIDMYYNIYNFSFIKNYNIYFFIFYLNKNVFGVEAQDHFRFFVTQKDKIKTNVSIMFFIQKFYNYSKQLYIKIIQLPKFITNDFIKNFRSLINHICIFFGNFIKDINSINIKFIRPMYLFVFKNINFILSLYKLFIKKKNKFLSLIDFSNMLKLRLKMQFTVYEQIIFFIKYYLIKKIITTILFHWWRYLNILDYNIKNIIIKIFNVMYNYFYLFFNFIKFKCSFFERGNFIFITKIRIKINTALKKIIYFFFLNIYSPFFNFFSFLYNNIITKFSTCIKKIFQLFILSFLEKIINIFYFLLHFICNVSSRCYKLFYDFVISNFKKLNFFDFSFFTKFMPVYYNDFFFFFEAIVEYFYNLSIFNYNCLIVILVFFFCLSILCFFYYLFKKNLIKFFKIFYKYYSKNKNFFIFFSKIHLFIKLVLNLFQVFFLFCFKLVCLIKYIIHFFLIFIAEYLYYFIYNFFYFFFFFIILFFNKIFLFPYFLKSVLLFKNKKNFIKKNQNILFILESFFQKLHLRIQLFISNILFLFLIVVSILFSFKNFFFFFFFKLKTMFSSFVIKLFKIIINKFIKLLNNLIYKFSLKENKKNKIVILFRQLESLKGWKKLQNKLNLLPSYLYIFRKRYYLEKIKVLSDKNILFHYRKRHRIKIRSFFIYHFIYFYRLIRKFFWKFPKRMIFMLRFFFLLRPYFTKKIFFYPYFYFFKKFKFFFMRRKRNRKLLYFIDSEIFFNKNYSILVLNNKFSRKFSKKIKKIRRYYSFFISKLRFYSFINSFNFNLLKFLSTYRMNLAFVSFSNFYIKCMNKLINQLIIKNLNFLYSISFDFNYHFSNKLKRLNKLKSNFYNYVNKNYFLFDIKTNLKKLFYYQFFNRITSLMNFYFFHSIFCFFYCFFKKIIIFNNLDRKNLNSILELFNLLHYQEIQIIITKSIYTNYFFLKKIQKQQYLLEIFKMNLNCLNLRYRIFFFIYFVSIYVFEYLNNIFESITLNKLYHYLINSFNNFIQKSNIIESSKFIDYYFNRINNYVKLYYKKEFFSLNFFYINSAKSLFLNNFISYSCLKLKKTIFDFFKKKVKSLNYNTLISIENENINFNNYIFKNKNELNYVKTNTKILVGLYTYYLNKILIHQKNIVQNNYNYLIFNFNNNNVFPLHNLISYYSNINTTLVLSNTAFFLKKYPKYLTYLFNKNNNLDVGITKLLKNNNNISKFNKKNICIDYIKKSIPYYYFFFFCFFFIIKNKLLCNNIFLIRQHFNLLKKLQVLLNKNKLLNFSLLLDYIFIQKIDNLFYYPINNIRLKYNNLLSKPPQIDIDMKNQIIKIYNKQILENLILNRNRTSPYITNIIIPPYLISKIINNESNFFFNLIKNDNIFLYRFEPYFFIQSYYQKQIFNIFASEVSKKKIVMNTINYKLNNKINLNYSGYTTFNEKNYQWNDWKNNKFVWFLNNSNFLIKLGIYYFLILSFFEKFFFFLNYNLHIFYKINFFDFIIFIKNYINNIYVRMLLKLFYFFNTLSFKLKLFTKSHF